MKCIECEREIDLMADVCPYCGAEQYDDVPAPEPMVMAPKKNRKILREFSDEEILGMGLHPKDESYKMSLISMILGKR